MSQLLIIAGTALIVLLGMTSIRLGFFAFVAIYSLYPRVLAVGILSQGFALSLQFTGAIALIVCWVYKLLMGEPKAQRALGSLGRAKRLSALIVIMPTVTVIATLLTEPSATNLIPLGLDLVFFLGVFFLTLTAVQTIDDIVSLSTVLIVTLLVVEALAVVEFFLGEPIFQEVVEVSYAVAGRNPLEGRFRAGAFRVQSVFPNPLLLTYFILLMVPFAPLVVNHARRRWMRWSAYLALGLVLPVIYWTGSRAGVVLAVLLFCFLVARRVEGSMTLTRPLRWVVILCMTVLAAVAVPVMLNYVHMVLLETQFSLDDTSTAARMGQYSATMIALQDDWLLGFGRQRNTVVALAEINRLDNYYLDTALQSGVLGLALLVVFLMMVWGRVRHLLRRAEDPIVREFAVAAGVFLVLTSISMALIRQPYHWVYLYVVAAVLVTAGRRSFAAPRSLASHIGLRLSSSAIGHVHMDVGVGE